MQTMVEYANELYRANGLRLLFDPNSDVANVNSSGLRLLGQGATIKCPDNNQMTDIGVCAQRYAASKWPEKIVVYVRGTEADPGNGFSGGGSAFIVLGLYRYKMVCGSGGDTGVPDKFWLAHELGHYLGLMHNQVNLDYVTGYTEASQLLKNANDNIQVFDADFLPDTPPGVHWDDCALPHDRVFNMTLAGKNGPVTFLVDNDNAMSYYYSENRRLTGNQSKLIRATAITRWY
jgi:hypothetical protein